jgi:hypothetical protein
MTFLAPVKALPTPESRKFPVFSLSCPSSTGESGANLTYSSWDVPEPTTKHLPAFPMRNCPSWASGVYFGEVRVADGDQSDAARRSSLPMISTNTELPWHGSIGGIGGADFAPPPRPYPMDRCPGNNELSAPS